MQIDRKLFVKEFEWAKGFAPKKSAIPILSTIAIVAQPGSITLMSTDLELGGITRLEVEHNEDWSLTVSAQTLLAYFKKIQEPTINLKPIIKTDSRECFKCKGKGKHPEALACPDCEKKTRPEPGCLKCKGSGNLDGDPIECEECHGEKVLKTTTYRLQVSHGEDSVICIDGMNPETFPVLPVPPITSYIAGLDVAAPRAMVSISMEESRFTLNGALLHVDASGAKLIATDGHRLGIIDVQVATQLPEIKTLIHKRALAEIKDLNGGKVFFGLDEHHHIFTDGKRTVVARKLKGNFPDWNRVVPKELAHSIQFDSAAMDKVLDRIVLFADERSKAITLNVHAGKVTAEAHSVDRGAAKGAVPAEGVNGTNFTCGYNATYLRDFLHLAPGTVEFGFNDEKSAGVFQTEGWKTVIMPMRI